MSEEAKVYRYDEKSKFTVGQKVFFYGDGISTNRKGIQEATITKIGRKFIHTEHSKFNPDTMTEVLPDNAGGLGRKVYRTIEEYDYETKRNQAWAEIKKMTEGYTAPKYISLSKLEAIIIFLKPE